MDVNLAAKEALAVTTGFAENGGLSSDMFFTDLVRIDGSSSSTNATLSRACAEFGDKNTFKEAAAYCVPCE